MKRKYNILMLFLTVSAIIIIFSLLYIWGFAMNVNSKFATEAKLEYHYNDTNISLTITDTDDFVILQNILAGRVFKDSPSCGFSVSISITMTNGQKSIVFCIANDGCPLLRIDETNKYLKISDDDRVVLNIILEKYGMIFPCI